MTVRPILFLLLLLSASATYAQDIVPDEADTIYEDESTYIDYESQDMFRLLDSPRVQIGLFLATTPFMTQQSFGGGIDVQAWYTNNLAVGLSFSGTGRKVTPTFGYLIGQSLLTCWEVSLFNELKLKQWHGFEAGLRLYTGYANFNLADNTLKEKYTWYDEYGFAYEGERAVTIARNHFLRLAPAVTLRYAINRDVLIEGSAAYNFYIGGPNFGALNDFRNYQLQLGVKINVQ